MTHRRGWYVLLAVSVAVQLSDISRHFHTGEELGVTRFSSGLSQGNAMTLVGCRKTGPCFLYLVASGLLTLYALLKTGLPKTFFQLPLSGNSVTDRVHIKSWDVIRSRRRT
jgi:hypothetical protein